MNSDHTALGLNYLGEKSIKKLGRTEINSGFPSTQSELETASPKGKGYVPCALSPALKKLILLLTGEHLSLIPQPLPVSPRYSRAPHASPQRPTQSRHPVTTAQQLQATSTRRYEQENGVTCRAPALASNPWPTVIPTAIPTARGGEAPETLSPSPGTQLQGLHKGRAPAQLVALQQRPHRPRGTAGVARRPCPARVPFPAAP